MASIDAKEKKHDISLELERLESDTNEIHTTSRGYVVEFLSIPNLMGKLREQYPLPEVPTYQVPLATGGFETHVHDETTLETEEDKEVWRIYESDAIKRSGEYFEAQMRLCLLRGIKILNEDIEARMGQWLEEQELIGFVVPTEPARRKLHFLQTEIAGDSEDAIAILAGVSRASGIAEEAVSNMENAFRSALGRARRNKSNGVANPVNGEGVVVVKPIRGNGHRGQKSNHKTKRVGHPRAQR